MKKYWLLLESYVFVWRNDDTVLLYNTLSGKHLRVTVSTELQKIITGLLDEENLYCIELTEDDLACTTIKSFVESLRLHYMGDLYPQSLFPQKPLVVVPSVSINEDLENTIEKTNNLELFGQKVMNNLHAISIRLIGHCDLHCTHCNNLHRQLNWCKKHKGILEYAQVKKVLDQMEQTRIPLVRFLGGNLFLHPEFSLFTELLKQYSFSKHFYLYYGQAMEHSSFWHIFNENPSWRIHFLVSFPICEEWIEQTISLRNERVEYIFPIASMEDFDSANSCIEKYQLEATLLPFYVESQSDFFENFVYQDIEDIEALHRSKREIFANQRINSHFFGELLIDCDGLIYSNTNIEPIGKIGDDFGMLVFNEMKEGKIWNLTRDKIMPCKKCLYKFLCPSPSNYELVMNKFNLCHIM